MDPASNDLETNSHKVYTNEIEQGNALVKTAAFLVGLASCISGIVQLIDLGFLLTNFTFYLLSVYQVFFAITTMLFEAKPDWVVKIQDTIKLPVSSYQDTLMNNAAFLTTTGGRGLFYVFLGSLWFGFPEGTHASFLTFLTGLALLVVGIVHIAMHFGIMPHHVVAKVQATAQGSYDHLAGRS
mmetsp:Transcript_99183/g.258576  ORF Transcript_99183/g.258576 Transcript_99183/m.258576 type:complete len:183 (+) Transcript_99183:59-607(+)